MYIITTVKGFLSRRSERLPFVKIRRAVKRSKHQPYTALLRW